MVFREIYIRNRDLWIEQEKRRRFHESIPFVKESVEVQMLYTALNAANAQVDYQRNQNAKLQVEIMRAYQEMQQQAQIHVAELQLKFRDMDLLYPNQIGAYPVHLNPPRDVEPLYLPAANGKYVPPETPAVPVKSFSELLRDGTINYAQSQNKMVLGYAGGELRFGSWLDLYSCGIGGVSGSGKTTTVRFLLFQAILEHSKLIMIDPHIGDPEESLAAQFLGFGNVHLFEPCNDAHSQVMRRIHYLRKELAERKLKGKKTPKIVLVIDEFNAVMRDEAVRKAIHMLLVAIAQEGRKFGIYAMLIGQRWSANDIGGADIRSSLASILAHRFTDVDQAKKLIGDGRQAAKCLSLRQGSFLFRDTDGALVEMTTPNTVAEDGEVIQRMLGIPETSSARIVESSIEMEPLKPVRNQSETSSETGYETSLEALGARIVELQAQKMTKKEIMKEIWDVSPGAGERYELANDQYSEAMAAISSRLKETTFF